MGSPGLLGLLFLAAGTVGTAVLFWAAQRRRRAAQAVFAAAEADAAQLLARTRTDGEALRSRAERDAESLRKAC